MPSPSTHDADFSPSAVARWLNCLGSAALCHGLPDKTSVHAEEGTLAHKVAEYTALMRLTDLDIFGLPDPAVEPLDFEPTEEMLDGADEWVAELADHVGQRGAEWATETPIDLSGLLDRPGAKGTADFYAVSGSKLVIADYKFGKGVRVDAAENGQLMLYAAGLLHSFDRPSAITEVELVIVQPRLNHISRWTTTPVHLKAFADKCRRAIKLATILIGNREEALKHLRPGEKQCRWCKAFGTCPAVNKLALEQSRAEDFKDLDALPVPADPDQLSRALGYIDLIERWCGAVREAATARLANGEAITGYKLVAGRAGPRRWISGAEEHISKMRLGKKRIYEQKLITPTQMEKLFKAGQISQNRWGHIQTLISRSEGKPSIAPEADKRPALEFKGEFNNLDA